MHLLLLFIILCSCVFPEDYKKTIAQYESSLQSAEGLERSDLFVKLAITYYLDQEHELAFKTFLKALEGVPQKEMLQLSSSDQFVYEEALILYLNQSGNTSQETAAKIQERFAEALQKNPNNYGLGFLMAASYANSHQFEDFFVTFFQAFKHAPHHYLAHKIKMIIYLKLFEKSRLPEEREAMRKKIEDEAQQALMVYSKDVSLYKFILQFTSHKSNQVEKILKKIISEDASIARCDILFYVQKAIEVKKFTLAQEFIDKMRARYPYSRVLSSAQECLDECKGEIGNGN